VRKRRLKQGRADAGDVAKQKRKIFLPGEVFFFLTCPLMGDPLMVSWNFKHIVNLNRIRLYNSVNLKLGYPMIEIRSPREVLDETI